MLHQRVIAALLVALTASVAGASSGSICPLRTTAQPFVRPGFRSMAGIGTITTIRGSAAYAAGAIDFVKDLNGDSFSEAIKGESSTFCFPALRWNGQEHAVSRCQYGGKPCSP